MLKNNKRKKGILLLLTVLYILIASFFVSGFLIDSNRSFRKGKIEFESKNSKLKSAGTYTNITIDDRPGSPNNWAWAKAQSLVTGSGTLLDPYIIEGHVLNMSSGTIGLHITNSTFSYFIIRNNIIQWNQLTNILDMTGIFLSNITKGKIVSNTIYNITKGIHLNNCSNVKIINNTIYDNTLSSNHMREGILVEYSYYLNISKNIVYNISLLGNGMFLNSSFSNEITDNKIYDIENGNGIKLENSNFTKVSENIVYNNEVGITLQESHNNIISRNSVSNNTDNGLVLGQSHNNSILENNINDNTQDGINMVNSNNNPISKNHIKDNILNGIFLSNSNDNIISGNKIQNNDDGINLYVSIYNRIYENSMDANNNRGIFADDFGTGSNYNLAYWNFFTGNVIHAIDATSTNYWNFTYIGNYWDNYTGVDTDHNGIGDTNHTFNGGIDYLPIWDLDLPTINIISPSDNDLVGRTAPSFIVGVTDVYLEDMWYTIDDHVNNILFTNNETFDQTLWETLWDSIAEMSSIYIIFYANDTFGHLGSNNVSVIKSVAPVITIIYPIEDAIFGAIAPNFTVEVVESNLDFMWYSVDGGLTNVIFITNGSISQSIWDDLPEGGVLIRFYANDSLGNLVFEQVHIFKEIPVAVPPTIGIDFISTSLILLIVIAGSIIPIIGGILKRKRKNL